MFDFLNSLNLKLQDGQSNIIYHRDAITAFTKKLQLCKRKVLATNYSCFPKLFVITQEACFMQVLDEKNIKTETPNHLQHLTDECKRYLPNTFNNNIYRLSTDPFHNVIDVLTEMHQEQGFEMKNDSACQI